jgi:hypothetical protein
MNFLDHKARILVRDYTGKYAWDCRLIFSRHFSLTESDIEKTKSPYLSHTVLHKETPFVPFIQLSPNLTSSSTSLSSASSGSSDMSHRRNNQLSVTSSEMSGDEKTKNKPFEISFPQSEYSLYYSSMNNCCFSFIDKSTLCCFLFILNLQMTNSTDRCVLVPADATQTTAKSSTVIKEPPSRPRIPPLHSSNLASEAKPKESQRQNIFSPKEKESKDSPKETSETKFKKKESPKQKTETSNVEPKSTPNGTKETIKKL